MFGIFLSALNAVLGFLFQGAAVKFLFLFGIYFVIAAFIGVLTQLLPQVSVLNTAFGSMTPAVWYFLDVFALSQGAPVVISAYAYTFLIRRIPLIG